VRSNAVHVLKDGIAAWERRMESDSLGNVADLDDAPGGDNDEDTVC